MTRSRSRDGEISTGGWDTAHRWTAAVTLAAVSLAGCTRDSNDSASTSTTEATIPSTTTTSRLSIEERVEQAADAVATQRGLADLDWFLAIQAMCDETSSSRIPMLYEELVNRILSVGDPTISADVLEATIAGMEVYCPTQGQLMEDAYLP